MKSAFVYYLEFTDDKNIYIKLLAESIRRLIEYKYSKGSDIFVNVIGYSGTPIWEGDKYVTVDESKDSVYKQLEELSDKYNINIIDVSESRLHYVELPILIDIPFPGANSVRSYTIADTTRLKIFNHKFTSYSDIIRKGYDRVIQLDADLFFFKEDDRLFEIPQMIDPDTVSFCRFNDSAFNNGLSNEIIITNIKNRIKEREHNIVKIFSLNNSAETRNSYQLAKNFILGVLDYNIDNFINDIFNQKYWVAGGLGIFDKPFIEKHFKKLSFINYFFTKDDEIALMMYCFANNIKINNLDPYNVICYERACYKEDKHIAYHPAGDGSIKTDFINNNWIPV
jgi:hypothetical protein